MANKQRLDPLLTRYLDLIIEVPLEHVPLPIELEKHLNIVNIEAYKEHFVKEIEAGDKSPSFIYGGLPNEAQIALPILYTLALRHAPDMKVLSEISQKIADNSDIFAPYLDKLRAERAKAKSKLSEITL